MRGLLFHCTSEVVCYFGMLNLSFPATGSQKFNEVNNECKLCTFYESNIATEVVVDTLGEE